MCQVFANASIVSQVTYGNVLRGVGPSCESQAVCAKRGSKFHIQGTLGCVQAIQACAVGSLRG